MAVPKLSLTKAVIYNTQISLVSEVKHTSPAFGFLVKAGWGGCGEWSGGLEHFIKYPPDTSDPF